MTALADAGSSRPTAPKEHAAEVAERTRRQRRGSLATAAPQATEDRYLPAAWGWKQGPADCERIAAAGSHGNCSRCRRPDGGSAPAGPPSASDTYATGQALYALTRQGDAVATTTEAYRRGIDYLLRTQDDDGSWYVQRSALSRRTPTSTPASPTASRSTCSFAHHLGHHGPRPRQLTPRPPAGRGRGLGCRIRVRPHRHPTP